MNVVTEKENYSYFVITNGAGFHDVEFGFSPQIDDLTDKYHSLEDAEHYVKLFDLKKVAIKKVEEEVTRVFKIY